jgi:hypothetical protein
LNSADAVESIWSNLRVRRCIYLSVCSWTYFFIAGMTCCASASRSVWLVQSDSSLEIPYNGVSASIPGFGTIILAREVLEHRSQALISVVRGPPANIGTRAELNTL